MPEFITTAETAELLGYTPQHVRRLVREGVLDGTKIGRDWVINRASVGRFLADRENLDFAFESST